MGDRQTISDVMGEPEADPGSCWGGGAAMAEASSSYVVYVAIAGNLLIAVTKTIATLLTGSSAMLSEAIHSFVDTGNEVLLLYGQRRARQPPDDQHPLGHGRELYFWSFIVALLIFAVGAAASAYEGVGRVLHPEPVADPLVSYVVLGLSFLFEGYSWHVAHRAFRAAKGDKGYWEAVRTSKDPPTFMVLFEDSAALIGLLIALIGTMAGQWLDMPVFDGVASIAIGIVLGLTAILLARESKGLLIGEGARPELARDVYRIAEAQPGISRANGLITVQLAPNEVMGALSVEFDPDITARQVQTAIAELERRVRAVRPEVEVLFVKPQTAAAFGKARARRRG
jgi:cation diffusion facilitator family transporter